MMPRSAPFFAYSANYLINTQNAIIVAAAAAPGGAEPDPLPVSRIWSVKGKID
jgi:hypothetical protein